MEPLSGDEAIPVLAAQGFRDMDCRELAKEIKGETIRKIIDTSIVEGSNSMAWKLLQQHKYK